MSTKAIILTLVALATLAALFVSRNGQTPTHINRQTLFASKSECQNNCHVLLTNKRFVESQYQPCVRFCSGENVDILSNPNSCYYKCKSLCEGRSWPTNDCFYDCSLTCMYNPILHRRHGAAIKGFWQGTVDPDSIWHFDMDSPNTFKSVELSRRAQFSAKYIRGDVNPDDPTKGTLTIHTPKGEDVTYSWKMEKDGKHFSLGEDRGDLCQRFARVNGASDVVKKAMAQDFVRSDLTEGKVNVPVTEEMEKWLTGKWTIEMTQNSREYEGTIVRPDTNKNFFKMKIEKNWSKKFIQDFELRFTSPKEGVMSVMYHSKKMDVPFVFDKEDRMRFFNQDGSLRALGTKLAAMV